MRVVNLEYKFLFFLYAYMRQIDLSLDRSRWVKWNELKEYYRSQIKPVTVSDQLLKITNLRLETSPIILSVKKPSFLRKIKDVIFRLIMKKQYLTDREALYCCQLLNHFDLYLNSFFTEYSLETEKLRIGIAKFYSYILEPKLSIKDYFKAMNVEHFMQDENIEVVKIGELIAGFQLGDGGKEI